ncbi:hypothetical protein OHA40_05680 [Nocardia sp. NBC_00508]|uniref:hypothetical protein n=1 Tax=Nocardia sp. NBC_00508 TaxID=2975992 RepID=UPI002E806345|nr:hypothetical protein [Nocardia sp. NBC_00508]WUD67622.1 hypothetical protein OHA40_05680 [Nocardia sp. NBC_00508]
MSTTQLVCATIAIVLLLGVTLFYVLPYVIDRPGRADGQLPVAEVLARVARDQCHRAPDRPYTVAEAQRVFRRRINCDVNACGAKHDAFWLLVDEGLIVPAREISR